MGRPAEADNRNTMKDGIGSKSKIETAIRDRIAERSYRELCKLEFGYATPYSTSGHLPHQAA